MDCHYGKRLPTDLLLAPCHGLTREQVVEYMTNELITKYGTDNAITAFVDKYDFYMFPVVNVDGEPQICPVE